MKKSILVLIAIVLAMATIANAGTRKEKDDIQFEGSVTFTSTPTFSAGVNLFTEVVTATNVITAAECGKTFFLTSGTEFVSTLPAISTVSAGCEFDFIITAAASGANYTVITGNSKELKLQGFINMGADAPDACANEDTITFVDGNAVGDRANVIFDGSNWIVSGSAVTDNKLTCTDEA